MQSCLCQSFRQSKISQILHVQLFLIFLNRHRDAVEELWAKIGQRSSQWAQTQKLTCQVWSGSDQRSWSRWSARTLLFSSPPLQHLVDWLVIRLLLFTEVQQERLIHISFLFIYSLFMHVGFRRVVQAFFAEDVEFSIDCSLAFISFCFSLSHIV